MKNVMKAVAALMLMTAVVWAVAFTKYEVNSNMDLKVGDGSIDGHEYVDLGLPYGTLWATCNIGADSPEDYGEYFAWGETKTKSAYNWGNYKYARGATNKVFNLTKYCFNYKDSNYGYNGFTDNLNMLQTTDDAATVNWGNGWCTPAWREWNALWENTTHTWTTRNGVQGMLFTSKKNGASIFLPAAGYWEGDKKYGAGNIGGGGVPYWACDYWMRDLSDRRATEAQSVWWLESYDRIVLNYDRYRAYGLPVRPVHETMPLSLHTPFKLFFSVKDQEGVVRYKQLGVADDAVYIIDFNGEKYTVSFEWVLGFHVWHGREDVKEPIELTPSQFIALAKLARNTGDPFQLSPSDVENLPEGQWGSFVVESVPMKKGLECWTEKIIKIKDKNVIRISVESNPNENECAKRSWEETRKEMRENP